MKLFGFEITRHAGLEKRGLLEDMLHHRAAQFEGGYITPPTAMGITAIWACVNKISKIVAMIPWGAMIRSADGGRLSASDHPLHRILALRPNNYQTSFVFRQQAMVHLLLWGNFFAEIQFDRISGEPLGLYPVHPSEVTVKLAGGQKTFQIKGKLFSDDQIFHLMGHSLDGIRGISPIAVHRSTLNTSKLAADYVENFYANGTKLSGYLKHPGKLGPEGIANLRNAWSDVYAGAANAGKVAITEEGMEFMPLTMPMADAQFAETRKLQIADAARIFDMPLHKLAEMDGAKFNNVEQQNISFVIDTIQPLITCWEQEANWKLVLPEERGRLYTRFNLASLLRGDFQSRMAGYAILRQWSLATINELRALEDWNPIEGGDNLFVGGNAQISAITNMMGIGTGQTSGDPVTEEET